MTPVRSVTGEASGGEPQRPARRAVVAVERRWRAAAGEEQVAAAVVVAVERGHPAADEVLEVALVAVIDPAAVGHEVRRVRRRRALRATARGERSDQRYGDQRAAAEPPHEPIEAQRPTPPPAARFVRSV